MPAIIKHFNSPKEAVTLDGYRVRREDKIFLKSYNEWFPVLQTDIHFCFKEPSGKSGRSTIMCTCGGFAATFSYDAYKKYSSFIGSQVIACHDFIQYGTHADNSHE